MRLRDRLANAWLGFIDLISGGALTRAINDAIWWRDHMVGEIYGPMVDAKNDELIRGAKNQRALHDALEKAVSCGAEILGREITVKQALSRIAAMETPNCANIGKRMAQVARGALE